MLNVSAAMTSAAIKSYFGSSHDYYAEGLESQGVCGGKLMEEFGLKGTITKEQFDRLADGYHPITGDDLVLKRQEERRAANDITFSAPKPVTLLYVRTKDERILKAFEQTCDDMMAIMEKDAAARVRLDGMDEDRITGNWGYSAHTHLTARPDKVSEFAAPQLHRHHVVWNLTRDPVEKRIKALQIGMVKENADLYMPMFHNLLAKRMKELGYGIERTGIVGFGIKGVSRGLVDKFSPRRQTILAMTQEFAKERGITNPETLRQLQAEVAVVSRNHKQKNLGRDELWKFWESQLTKKDLRELDTAKKQKGWKTTNAEALKYACEHLFYRNSVVPEKKLLIEALRYGVGSVDLEGIKAEYGRKGVLLKDGEATTRKVLAEETKIIEFAREGKGTCRPLSDKLWLAHELPDLNRHTIPTEGLHRSISVNPTGQSRQANPQRPATTAKSESATLSPKQQSKVTGEKDKLDKPKTLQSSASKLTINKVDNLNLSNSTPLSAEQLVINTHIWESTDKVIMIEGDAGTGKTTAMRRTIPGIDKPGVFLAPSASASRGTLRNEGFRNADTIARFLVDDKFRAQAKDGFIYIDEAPLAGIKDIAQVFEHAKKLNARVILQGDRKQMSSPARHGNLFPTLEKYAGLPIGRLTEIYRQKNKAYKEAVASIAKGDILKGYDTLDKLGWVIQTDSHKPLVDEYMAETSKKKSVLVVAPTHLEGDAITKAIRDRLKEEGKLKDEKEVNILTPIHWTDAQKGDPQAYSGEEVIKFHRNSGAYRAGQSIRASDVVYHKDGIRPEHLSVYSHGSIGIAAGDVIRLTANGWATDAKGGKHRIDNGKEYTVKGFKEGHLALDNGWLLPTDNPLHITHGYVSTSHASQGKTVDVVLGAMGSDSLGAMNAKSFYVTASRGRQAFKLYTDLKPEEIREAIKRQDHRKSATELMGQPTKQTLRHRTMQYMKMLRDRFRLLRERTEQFISQPARLERQHGIER